MVLLLIRLPYVSFSSQVLFIHSFLFSPAQNILLLLLLPLFPFLLSSFRLSLSNFCHIYIFFPFPPFPSLPWLVAVRFRSSSSPRFDVDASSRQVSRFPLTWKHLDDDDDARLRRRRSFPSYFRFSLPLPPPRKFVDVDVTLSDKRDRKIDCELGCLKYRYTWCVYYRGCVSLWGFYCNVLHHFYQITWKMSRAGINCFYM